MLILGFLDLDEFWPDLETNENQNENKLNIKLDIKSQRSQIKKGDSSISKINNTSANFDILNTGTYINH